MLLQISALFLSVALSTVAASAQSSQEFVRRNLCVGRDRYF
jgi:hypothetical protein